MNLNEVRGLVDMAIADLSQRGVEYAWEKLEGDKLTVLRWSDIRAALSPVEGFASASVPSELRGERANGYMYDESSEAPKEDTATEAEKE